MKALAKKIGAPVDKYDDVMKQIQIRVLGEDGYNKFIANQKDRLLYNNSFYVFSSLNYVF